MFIGMERNGLCEMGGLVGGDEFVCGCGWVRVCVCVCVCEDGCFFVVFVCD